MVSYRTLRQLSWNRLGLTTAPRAGIYVVQIDRQREHTSAQQPNMVSYRTLRQLSGHDSRPLREQMKSTSSCRGTSTYGFSPQLNISHNSTPAPSTPRTFSRLAVLHSGNVLASIKVVALHQTRLVPGWLTVCGPVNHLGMLPATQVDSAFYHPWDGKMSISFRAE